MKNFTLLFVLALLSGLLTSCSGPMWFHGKFQFDQEATANAQKAKEGTAKDKEGILGALQNLGRDLMPKVVELGYGNAIFTITAGEIAITEEGKGHVVKYEVHEQPNADTVVIKREDGTLETWRKSANGVILETPKAPIPIYFKRVP